VIATVAKVREVGQFSLVSDELITDRIEEATAEVTASVTARRVADPAWTITESQIGALIVWRACDLLSATERSFVSESGDGLSGSYDLGSGRFRREYDRAWAKALGASTLLTRCDLRNF